MFSLASLVTSTKYSPPYRSCSGCHHFLKKMPGNLLRSDINHFSYYVPILVSTDTGRQVTNSLTLISTSCPDSTVFVPRIGDRNMSPSLKAKKQCEGTVFKRFQPHSYGLGRLLQLTPPEESWYSAPVLIVIFIDRIYGLWLTFDL